VQTNIPEHFAVVFPIFFASLWIVISVVLARMSGWHRLVERFPDRAALPQQRLRFQSGSMGPGVNMNGILMLDVCQNGLRVGILRIFGLFSKPFFVPWQAIRVTRTKRWLMPVALLEFGNPKVGELMIRPRLAERLASAADGNWPEETIPLPESAHVVARRAVTDWIAVTVFVIAVLLVLSMAFTDFRPPFVTILVLPALVLGVSAIVHYIRNRP
jgi:hypothetical protein